MAIPYTGNPEIFTVGETSPSAFNVLFGGEPIILCPEDGGEYVALKCIKPNPLNKDSKVNLDDSVEPPELNLHEAITVILPVNIDTETGDLTIVPNQIGAKRVVSGTYAGAGSNSRLTIL